MSVRPMRVGLAVLGLAMTLMGCSGSSSSGFGGGMQGGQDGGGGGGGGDATTGGKKDGGGGITLGNDSGSGLCVPPSCADLNATCGAVTDTLCGGVVQCGTCKAGESCGAKKANQCAVGSADDGGSCTKETCASQGVTCGSAGDGCGATLSCGTCSLPQICGGDPTKPGTCGCTGTCASVPTCTAGTTTTLTGKVLDPAGLNGLYNVLVYVPNDTTDSGLQPFPAGVVCDVCGATAAGDPLVTTYTAPDGTFTLSGVPTGASVPLIIQLGKWRRQFTVPIPTACSANTVAAGTLTMPKNHSEGDMPRIAILTGELDPVECVLYKIGIDQSEFTDPGVGGYINFYSSTGYGPGEVIDSATPAQPALMAGTGGPGGTPEIDNYDMTIIECEGYPPTETASDQAVLAAYTAAGGRVFASDFAYSWLYQNPALSAAADWNGNHSGANYVATSTVNLPTSTPPNPVGGDFQEWLEAANVPGAATNALSMTPIYHNTTSIVAPTQEWLSTSTAPVQFSYNTPIGAASANQCGRVTFSDWHSDLLDGAGDTFPGVCPGTALTPQEAILEFMIFDLSACVQPYTPVCTPTTCAAQGIECGYAGDGCGNALTCGTCASGQTCGGGGAGKCGTTVTCTPKTCAGQGIQCGPAGDGCGNEIQCGNCATGEICGLSAAGQCGTPISK